MFKKVVLALVVMVVLTIGLVFGLRLYNNHKYEKDKVDQIDVTDLSIYNTDIENVEVKHISGTYLNGFHLKPASKIYSGLVITFGGSEGSPAYSLAAELAQAGYEVLSLFYFGMPNQKPTLKKIPLDSFGEVKEYIDHNIGPDETVTLYGGSKGAELILNLALKFDWIDNLVLVSPSAYTFSGLDFQEIGSSWTYEGVELPYVDTTKSDAGPFFKSVFNMVTYGPVSYLQTYQSALDQDKNVEAKRIKVENIKPEANILLFAGTDDQLWPSSQMANTIKQYRPKNTDLHIYQDAGHIFGNLSGVLAMDNFKMSIGGSLEKNQEAYDDYIATLYSKLKEWHQIKALAE